MIPNSDGTSPKPKPLVLEIRGCGNIVSFKNSKMVTRGKLITAPEKQEAMQRYSAALESALYSAFRTSETATPTGCSLRSWIASSVPADDSWKHIPKSDGYECIEVPEGEEGADIIIEPL